MDIAVSSLIILALLFPGILFRFSYRKGNQAEWKQNNFLTFRDSPEEIGWATLFAIPLHAIAMCILSWLNFLPGAGEIIVRLIIGKLDSDVSIQTLTVYVPWIGFYVVFTSAFGAFCGSAIHHIVDYWFLDIRWPSVFYFSNNFDYMLNGRSNLLEYTRAEFKVKDSQFPTREELQKVWERYLLRVLYVVVMQSDAAYVYGGFLEHYEFNPAGELDMLVLEAAFRFPLPTQPEDSQSKKSPHMEFSLANIKDVPGYLDIAAKRFVIQYKDVKTLALEYFTVIEEEEDPENKS